MRKKVIQFPRKATPALPTARQRSQIMIHIGSQSYALDVATEAAGPDPGRGSRPTGGAASADEIGARCD
jgi:hypothetical protein